MVHEEQFWACVEKINAHVPFEQTKAWHDFKQSERCSFLYFVDNPADPQQACWGRVYTIKFVGRVLDIMGEIQKECVTHKMITTFFREIIKQSAADMLTYNSVKKYDEYQDIGLRRAGLVRSMGNRACPLTQIIPLQLGRDCDRNWKRNLRKANTNKLKFEVVENPSVHDAATVCNLFDELKERKQLGFSLDQNKILHLLMQEGFVLCYVKHENQILCARIIYHHQGLAADVFAANGFESMKYSATHFIMEQIFCWLKEQGDQLFDFSRISPGAYETDSIYQFKDAAGGYPMQYLGEWVWTKKHRTQLLFCIYNFFLHHRHNY